MYLYDVVEIELWQYLSIKKPEFRLFLCLFLSKQGQLGGKSLVCDRFFAPIKFHTAKLCICDFKQNDLSERRYSAFHSFFVHFCIFTAAAVSGIHTVLHHLKAVLYQKFSEFRIGFAFLFGLGWKVKMYKYPHNFIFV